MPSSSSTLSITCTSACSPPFAIDAPQHPNALYTLVLSGALFPGLTLAGEARVVHQYIDAAKALYRLLRHRGATGHAGYIRDRPHRASASAGDGGDGFVTGVDITGENGRPFRCHGLGVGATQTSGRTGYYGYLSFQL